MSEYTQGGCQDGAAILRDGQMMTIEEILEALRERDALEFQKHNREGLVRRAIEMEEAYGGLAEKLERLRIERDEISRDYDMEHYHRLAVERSEQALAAHVERFNSLMDELAGELDGGDEFDSDHIPADLWILRRSAPTTSLARRDALKRAEALDCEPLRILMGLVEDGTDGGAWAQVRNLIAYRDELRREAQEATP